VAATIGDLAVVLNADTAPAERAFRAFGGTIDRLGQKTKAFSAGLAAVATTAFGVAGGGLLADAFKVPGDLLGDSLRLAASYERSATAFEVMLGSASDAKRLMADLQRFAAESPLTLSRTTDEAAKLLASGVGRSQVVPTLRMLSDLTAGDAEKLSRAALAFTQVRSAGVLQGDELNQLRELGIPIQKELAKVKGVGEDALKGLQQAGQVTFADLAQAMKNLTSEGGKFFGMTAKGAATLSGRWEQLADAADSLKREFGRIVVEEIGLVEGAQDGAKFLDQMKVTLNDIRPAVRFVGEVLKGTAQVVGEVARNASLFGEVFGGALRDANPRLGRLMDALDRGAKALQSFKADPQLIATIGIDLAEGLSFAFADVFTSLGEGVDAVYEAHIRPVLDGVKDAADLWRRLKDGAKGAADLADFAARGGPNLGGVDEAQRRTALYARAAAAGGETVLAKLAAAKQAGETLAAAMESERRNLEEAKRRGMGGRFAPSAAAEKARTALLAADEALAQALGQLAPAVEKVPTVFDKLRAGVEERADRFKQRFLPDAAKELAAGAALGGAAFLKDIRDEFMVEAAAGGGRLESRPAPAAEYGTQEFVRLVQQAAGGGQDVPGLLREVKAGQDRQTVQLSNQLEQVRQAIRLLVPGVKLPGA
jgi:tape measure domain-containing protein